MNGCMQGAHVDSLAAACEAIGSQCSVDFVDLNAGCPIDGVCYKGMGAGLLQKSPQRSDPCPLTCSLSDVSEFVDAGCLAWSAP